MTEFLVSAQYCRYNPKTIMPVEVVMRGEDTIRLTLHTPHGGYPVWCWVGISDLSDLAGALEDLYAAYRQSLKPKSSQWAGVG